MCVGSAFVWVDRRELGGAGRVRRELGDALARRRAAIARIVLVVDEAEQEGDGIGRVHCQLGSYTGCMVFEEFLEEVGAHRELVEVEEESVEARVVGVRPDQPLRASGGGDEVVVLVVLIGNGVVGVVGHDD